jgi:hypothetical protein
MIAKTKTAEKGTNEVDYPTRGEITRMKNRKRITDPNKTVSDSHLHHYDIVSDHDISGCL